MRVHGASLLLLSSSSGSPRGDGRVPAVRVAAREKTSSEGAGGGDERSRGRARHDNNVTFWCVRACVCVYTDGIQ